MSLYIHVLYTCVCIEGYYKEAQQESVMLTLCMNHPLF